MPKHVRRISAHIGDVHSTVTQSVGQSRASVVSISDQMRIYAYLRADIDAKINIHIHFSGMRIYALVITGI